MKALRVIVIVVIAGGLVSALLLDRGTRPRTELAAPVRSSVPVATGEQGTWFCPGGSAPGGRAEVSLELVNVGSEPATASITGVRSGSGVAAGHTTETVPGGERVTVVLADHVGDSAWLGAIVEVDSGDVVVEQTFVGSTGTDRAPCHTRTATRWIVPSGATRRASHGEEMFLLLLNPFFDDAVVDIVFDADVGVDSIDGVVVPARRVVALNVTEEVTVAARVSAVIDVIAGRLAVSRLQVFDGEDRVGLAVTPAASEASAVWYLPTVHRGTRDDVISVTNPSPDQTAEVDLEITADGDTRLDPIELTIRPGRTVAVALADEARLEVLTDFSITARSLSGLPVAVMVESSRGASADAIPTAAATIGADVASTRWIAPSEGDQSVVVIFNVAGASIATVEVTAVDPQGRRVVAEIEIEPGHRAVLRAADIGGDRPILEIVSSVPVVVGRDLIGASSHRMAPAVVAGPAVGEDRLG